MSTYVYIKVNKVFMGIRESHGRGGGERRGRGWLECCVFGAMKTPGMYVGFMSSVFWVSYLVWALLSILTVFQCLMGEYAKGTLYVLLSPHRHTVQSEIWASRNLSYYEGKGYTIRDALHVWYHNGSEGGMAFHGMCSGPRCNDNCPEELILQGQGTKVWSAGVRITIATAVALTALFCLLMKV